MAAIGGSAEAQLLRHRPAGPVAGPPKGTPPAEAEIWPFPPPDPKAWWEDKRPVPAEAADPLGGRRLGAHERLIALANGIDPSTYRLWGLMPLQWQLLRGEEMILEVWVRPARSVRQSVIRITVRQDGKGFVQARAGLACCEAGIARRMGFDAELTPVQTQAFLGLRGHPMWAAPRDVRVTEGADTVEDLCVDGTSYDLTLVVPGRSRSLRRACDAAAIGQVAEALEPALAAALGHDTRFDTIYPGGPSFAAARDAYRDLIAHGGALKPQTHARVQPPELGPGGAPAAGEAAATPAAARPERAPSPRASDGG
jgi:hypothetical protein